MLTVSNSIPPTQKTNVLSPEDLNYSGVKIANIWYQYRLQDQQIGEINGTSASLRPPLRPSGPADWPRPNSLCLPVNHAKLQLIKPNLPLITPKNQINWHLPKKCAVDITINCTWRQQQQIFAYPTPNISSNFCKNLDNFLIYHYKIVISKFCKL